VSVSVAGVERVAATARRRPVAVFSPSGEVGGVERVARQVHAALDSDPAGSVLHVGVPGILRSPRPRERWMALTWKTHALAAVRHPGVSSHGLLWLHGAELTRDAGRVQGRLRARVLDTAELLLAVSPLAVELLLPAHLRSRVQLVGPPVPAAGPARPRSARSGQLRLLSVGRAVPRKGHDVAIETARLLAARSPTRLDVVGPGPDLPRLRALAAAAARPGLKVTVHGAVPEDVKEQLYADADALLFLPRSEEGEYEGLGLVVLEAAARGCPAVVLDCGGSRFGVVDGRTGALLPAGSAPGAVAETVRDLVRSDLRAAASSYAARFALPAWQQRVRALAAGERPDWEWPSGA
jgi:glycosyltransferase involved in cell wall biosynthesis